MSKYVVVSVFDSAANGFGRPAFVAAVGAAMRGFSDEVNRSHEENPMNRHPADFTLYELGTWDDADGRFELHDRPKSLVRAVDVIIKPN